MKWRLFQLYVHHFVLIHLINYPYLVASSGQIKRQIINLSQWQLKKILEILSFLILYKLFEYPIISEILIVLLLFVVK